jgi:uncharacterized protein (TIGR02996 family)
VNEYDAMLRAICAEPDEDTPRLAAADWLDEREKQVGCGACKGKKRRMVKVHAVGGFGAEVKQKCPTCSGTGRVSNGYAARAEFIRVQVGLAREKDGDNPISNGLPLYKRMRELWHAGSSGGVGAKIIREGPFDAVLTDSLTPCTPGDFVTGYVSRGFVSSITLPCAAFMQHARVIFEIQPVTRVVLSGHSVSEFNERFWIEDQVWESHPILRREIGPLPSFKSRCAAIDALSNALVTMGRELANLPPLRRAEPVTARGGAGVLVNEREG